MKGKCRHEASEDSKDNPNDTPFCFNFYKYCPGYENCEDYEEEDRGV